MPTLLIGILFGLAMDYQMFLVSGMHEAYMHGKDARTSVRDGFVSGARVVAAAALIMVSVFSGFIWAEMTMARSIGFGLAIGVLLDAFLVRMTFTPAVMSMLGDKAWWLPGWLDRLLPNLDVEGARLAERLRQEGDEVAEERERELAGVS
jgi:RND superfamily putative drug exporter